MNRTIVGFAADDVGDWVALLDCLHRQHVRHHPPFRVAPWVEDDEQRARRIGTTLDCLPCERCEVPAGLRLVRTTPTWDETTMPAALRRAHRIAAGTWGRIRIESGALRFVASTDPVTVAVLAAGDTQGIPPDVEHHVEPWPTARFAVDFLGGVSIR